MAIIWTKLIPRWDGLTIEPPEAKKDVGYIAGDKPPAKWENWLRKGTYEALDETRDAVDYIDDLIGFETGTFTPDIKGSTTAGVHTYSQQQGKYNKIGNQIFFSINIILTAKDAAMAGGVQIGGLPFTQDGLPYESINIGSINVNMTDTARTVGGIIIGSNINLYEFFDNANTVALQSASILATTQIRCSGVYEIA